MKRVSVCTSVCICGLLLRAADEPKPKIELPREVQPVVDLARSSAPEVFADAVVRLVEVGRIPQREAQIDLLEQAFAAAANATEPIRLVSLPNTPTDTRELYRSRAGDLGLNTLALQSRILKELLTVDPAKARELFSAIERPILDPRPCEDPFIADASAYYEIAAAVAQSAFSAAEKDKEAHVQFLSAILAGIRSPNELAPFARSLQGVALNPSEWALLGAGLVEKLNTVAPDYRPFALSFDALQAEVRTLAELAQIPDMHDAFRKYALTQLTAPRCAPDFAIDAGDLPLSSGETNPSKRNETFKTSDAYFSSGDAKLIGERLLHLQSLRQEGDFRTAFSDFLRDFRAWAPTGNDADVLHQRATIFGALLQLLPPGDDRDRVVNLCAAMLASSAAQKNAPAEWIWQMHHLAEIAGGDAPKLFAAFRSSGDAPLVVYGYLFIATNGQE